MDASPYLNDMTRWSRRFFQDVEKAADLVQDTCVRLLRLQFDPERGMTERSFVYLVMQSTYHITLNKANSLKRSNHEVSLSLLPETREPGSAPRQENMIFACELMKQACRLTWGEQRALGKTIVGDKLTHSERTMLSRARKTFWRTR